MKTNQPWLPLFLLVLVSGLDVAVLAMRIGHSGTIYYIFLIWNLLLAWVPLGFALLGQSAQKYPLVWLGSGFLWLLFLPNAPYIITDMIHLRPLGNIPLWYDALMLFAFALTGILLGFLSLAIWQEMVSARWGKGAGWVFAAVAVGLSSYGVYLGRFLRWNSWQIFTHPFALLRDILATSHTPKALVVSLVLSGVLGLTYALLQSLTLIYRPHSV